jgi:type IV secretory pathway TraG/TraD family ATPase VirD4
MSYKRKGAFGGKSDANYSTERRPIVEARDMMALREKGEAIAFIYGHYVRCKKIRYFEDAFIAPILKKRQEQISQNKQAQAQAEPTEKDTTT